jgi:ferredoxin
MPIVSIDDKNFEVNVGEILFDALDKRGLTLPHGCLAGSCGACRVEVLENPENLEPSGIIETDTIESLKQDYEKTLGTDSMKNINLRLSCRAKIKNSLKIKIYK